MPNKLTSAFAFLQKLSYFLTLNRNPDHILHNVLDQRVGRYLYNLLQCTHGSFFALRYSSVDTDTTCTEIVYASRAIINHQSLLFKSMMHLNKKLTASVGVNFSISGALIKD